jgi:hypothetical protein
MARMNVLLSFLLLALVTTALGHYRVSFNNNFKLNGRHQHGDGNDWETYLVGIESTESERDDDHDHFVGFRYDLFSAIAKHGECNIRLVETKADRCIDEAEDDVPFKQGKALRKGVVDGCADFYTVPELNWVAATSDSYLQKVTFELRKIALAKLDDSMTIAVPEEYYGPELLLQIRWLTGFGNEIVSINGDVEDIEEQIKKHKAGDEDNASYDAIFAPESFFDNLVISSPTDLQDNNEKVEISGLGVVARPDAAGLVSCVNDGLEAIRENGHLENLCTSYKMPCALEDEEDDDDDDGDDDVPDTTAAKLGSD